MAVGGFEQTPRVASSDSKADQNEIRQLVAKYARSVDEADITLAAQVWLDSPDVSFIHPLGHEHGFDQIKQNVYTHLMGETFSERKLRPRDVAVHVYGNSAWVEFYWDFVAKFRKDGSPITTHGRETQVYWKTPGGWFFTTPGCPLRKSDKGSNAGAHASTLAWARVSALVYGRITPELNPQWQRLH